MAYRQTVFALEEWYHCYTRSIDKRSVFQTPADYNRFLEALYLCNGTKSIQRSTLYDPSHEDFFFIEKGKPLVAIGAYTLMPNHFHLLLQEITAGGISKFMQKLGTSFTMYFNIKNEHIGNVFVKPFRSKHIKDDCYLKKVVQYIHLNPAELFDISWKTGKIRNISVLEKRLVSNQYSSLVDYYGNNRPQKTILNKKAMRLLGDLPPLADVLEEASLYYKELPKI